MNSIEGSPSPNAMVNDLGDYFYPDSIDDALIFQDDHGARPVDRIAFAEWFRDENFVIPGE